MRNSVERTAIIIPARYGSTRFEGKPLVNIAGKTMLRRVFAIANKAAEQIPHAEVIIATEDERIIEHALTFTENILLTPKACKTGSDRALATCEQLSYSPDYIITLQGDAPLTLPSFLQAIYQALSSSNKVDVATPIEQLSWDALDEFRQRKTASPLSGTTVTFDRTGKALWFSKQIIPAMRHEQRLRTEASRSPVYRHIGLYGYTYNALKRFVALHEGVYEALEGLEQLRMLENGMVIQTVCVSYGDYPSMSGVDTAEDAKKAENLILQYGELVE